MLLSFGQVKRIVRQRYPFLMIDKIIEFTKGQRVIGIKNVSINEPYFQGHFPEKKIMPGALIAEAMAQTASVLLYDEANKGKLFFLGSIKARFLSPIVPGDRIKIEAKPVKIIKDSGIIHAETYVGDKIVAKADFSFKTQ